MVKKIRISATFNLIAAACLSMAQASADTSVDEFIDMSLNDLLQLEVSSVSRRVQQLREAAAAVHVITADDIRRSGVTSIPDALRMVPGISVGRINASNWAVTARGFNGSFSNKLLVLMDGRTLYTPAFSGVYWDVQDTVLDNIERIEVIRGPGATLWGANAVNGIINIITKSAADTQGGLLVAHIGNEDKAGLSLRYGDAVGPDGDLRGHLKLRRTDEQLNQAAGTGANDEWEAAHGGLRFDGFLTNGDTLSVHGDFYRSESDQEFDLGSVTPVPVPDQVKADGWNLAGKWHRDLEDGGAVEVSAYVDFNSREEFAVGQEHLTLDIDFQHDLADVGRHNVIWGLGYRRIADDFRTPALFTALPASNELDLFSGFVQDEITLASDVRLTLGTKVEHNEFTGLEFQPNVRFSWVPNDQQMVWAAISRAVRTPSRVEEQGVLATGVLPTLPPTLLLLNGNPNLEAEELVAYEAGYRYTVENLSVDIAVYFNEYEELIGTDFTGVTSLLFENVLSGQSYGLEMSIDWRPSAWWRWQLAYTYQDIDLKATLVPPDLGRLAAGEGSVPSHQLSVRSSTDLTDALQLDVWGRYVGKLEASNYFDQAPVSSYTSLDVRLSWQATKDLELSLVGQNLLNSSHSEFVQGAFFQPTEIERSVFGQLKLTF